MPAHATAAQLADYLRTTEGQLPPDAGRVLGDVGALIDERAPDATAAAKRSVSLAVAARVLSNPQGIVQRQIGPHYTERYDQATARSPMALFSADLALLGVSSDENYLDRREQRRAGAAFSHQSRLPSARGATRDVERRW